MRAAVRCCLIAGVAAVVVAVPFLDFRAEYAHHKRLREVEPGVLYRAGQLTAAGFRDAVARTGARTVVNCQNELPGEDVFADPRVALSFWDRRTVRESAVCRDLGVRYVHLEPDLCGHRADPYARPAVIDQFLAVMDDPANRPVLLHCKAGLHRTGLLVAVYRMEYDGWDAAAAVAELKAHGFGDVACTAANDYVQQYVLNYRPRHAGERRALPPSPGSAGEGTGVRASAPRARKASPGALPQRPDGLEAVQPGGRSSQAPVERSEAGGRSALTPVPSPAEPGEGGTVHTRRVTPPVRQDP